MRYLTPLAEPLDLGTGRVLSPPAGWVRDGVSTDDPLWLLPKTRLRWTPPGRRQAILQFSLSATPLPEETMQALSTLTRGLPGPVSARRLEPLAGTLIRFPLEAITAAEVMSYPGSERLLKVTYHLQEYGDRGIVHYAPTERRDDGEWLLFAYEGSDPEYSEFLEHAGASFATFCRQDLTTG